VLEPFEVVVGHRVDAPVVDRQPVAKNWATYARNARSRRGPRLFDEVVENLQAVLLERDQVATIVVIIDPPSPHLRIAFAILAAVLVPYSIKVPIAASTTQWLFHQA